MGRIISNIKRVESEGIEPNLAHSKMSIPEPKILARFEGSLEVPSFGGLSYYGERRETDLDFERTFIENGKPVPESIIILKTEEPIGMSVWGENLKEAEDNLLKVLKALSFVP